jgi:hypothetical protein
MVNHGFNHGYFFCDILWDLSYDNQTWLAGKSPIYRLFSSHEPVFK